MEVCSGGSLCSYRSGVIEMSGCGVYCRAEFINVSFSDLCGLHPVINLQEAELKEISSSSRRRTTSNTGGGAGAGGTREKEKHSLEAWLGGAGGIPY